jgi:hypothetical protein
MKVNPPAGKCGFGGVKAKGVALAWGGFDFKNTTGFRNMPHAFKAHPQLPGRTELRFQFRSERNLGQLLCVSVRMGPPRGGSPPEATRAEGAPSKEPRSRGFFLRASSSRRRLALLLAGRPCVAGSCVSCPIMRTAESLRLSSWSGPRKLTLWTTGKCSWN